MQNNRIWNPTDNSRVTIDADLGRVDFRPLRKEDEGKYTCAAINDVGDDKSEATIRVLGMFLTPGFLFSQASFVFHMDC